jgi:PAS domain S-box-containing protein
MTAEKTREELLEEIADLRRQLDVAEATPPSLHEELLDAVPVLLAFLDRDLRYVFANRTYEFWLGVPPNTLLGRAVRDVVPPSMYAKLEPRLRTALAGDSLSFEVEMPTPDGQRRSVSATYVPKHGATGAVEGIFAIVTDVTHVTKITRDLERAHKMQALGQLTGGVAHDFNNLLSIVQGNVDLIRLRRGQQIEPFVDAILKATENGAALTSRLLSFSRRQNLSPTVLDVTERVRALGPVLRVTLGELNRLELDGCDGAKINADASQFENALVNLAANARDAMPKGGTFHVAVTLESIDDATRSAELEPGEYVAIRAKDNGVGIHPDDIGQVLEPFFTTKEKGRGTGLGLSTVYGFAKQSGGHLSISSEPGRGTEVSVYFPVAAAPEAAAAKPVDDIAGSARGRGKILLLEDNDALRDIPAQLLEGHGYEVTTVATGEQALQRLDSDGPYDLMFTDILLPGGMSGVDVAAEATRRHPALKVVYTTGYASDQLRERVQSSGGQPILAKPYRSQELLAAIAKALQP